MTHPPQLAPERIDQMGAFAASFAQDKRTPTFWQIVSTYKARFAISAMGSALVAASIVFFVSSQEPTISPVPHASPSEVSDIMLYDLLQDLS